MPIDLKKVSVLVVEDLAPMRAMLVAVLEAFGINKIYEASDGRQAFEHFQNFKPDIIITDWLMEPIDGLEFIRMVRKSKKSANPMVPIIVITGYSAMQRVTMARDLGATEFLTKPFTGRDLAKRINQIITRPRDFVETEHFFGPDRRRRKGEYEGPKRRMEDGISDESSSKEGRNSDMWDIVIK